jgi:hypothetical protein
MASAFFLLYSLCLASTLSLLRAFHARTFLRLVSLFCSAVGRTLAGFIARNLAALSAW